MGILAIITALLLEQWRPLGDRKAYFVLLARWAGWIERSFNAGEARHGAVAWLIAVGPAVLGAFVVHLLLDRAGFFFALAFDIAALYFTLGFRQAGHFFTDIQAALGEGDLDRARTVLAAWRSESNLLRSREEVVRLAIEEALLASHRHVFGVLLWYVLLPGPSGAILYRLAVFMRRRWSGPGVFGRFAGQACSVLEWPAVRLTAIAFALVGDFQGAVDCWRTQARTWSDAEAGIVLAAGAGALGVRLGMPIQGLTQEEIRPPLGTGEEAEPPLLESTVGLIWRALVLIVFMLALLSIVRAIG